MPQPTAYTRKYNFANYQTSNPTDPVPADQLEAEFNAVKQTTDETLANLALIQRDDGKLKNSTVHADSLSAAVRALILTEMNPRGNWATGTSYAVKDVVEQGGTGYICMAAHTSGVFEDDHAAGRWLSLGTAEADVTSYRVVATGSDTARTLADHLATLPDAQIAATGTTTPRSLAERFAVTVSPEDFGAAGDGVTDDYAAFSKMAAWANELGCGVHIKLGKGKTYLLDRHIESGNGVEDIIFQSIRGFRLDGNGSCIKVGGGFHRDVSSTRALRGLVLYDVTDFEVLDLELDGNNETITKAAGVSEGSSNGLLIGSCRRGVIKNVDTHNWHTDGVFVSGATVAGTNPRIASKDLTFINVKSTYNGRQGWSITQLRGGVFINCEGSETGQSTYGHHAPGAGWDIEPDMSVNTPPPNQMDVNTGRLVFINPRAYNNVGSTFTVVSYSSVDHVHLINPDFDVGPDGDNGSMFGFFLDVPGGIVDGGAINLRGKNGYLGYRQNDISWMVMRGVEVRGTASGLMSYFNIPVLIEGCRLIGEHTGPASKWIRIRNSKCRFRDNYVWVPGAAYTDSGIGDYHIITQIQGVVVSEGNHFETDLDAAEGSNGTAHFAVSYNDAMRVTNDKYTGTAEGSADTFRPGYNINFDTTQPYSRGIHHGGEVFAFGTHSTTRQFSRGTAEPTSGNYTRGDIVWNNNASAAGKIGWVCTSSGEAGVDAVFKEFGAIDA